LGTSKFGVLVVDDFAPFRRMISSILEVENYVRIVGEASDGLEAIKKAKELLPDLILLDVGLPKLDGIEAARRIRGLLPAARVIFVSQESSEEVVREALGTGAQGYVAKIDAWRDVVVAIKAALQGETFVSYRLRYE
jgi:DNA-binding NarL/FixJ family response regulator